MLVPSTAETRSGLTATALQVKVMVRGVVLQRCGIVKAVETPSVRNAPDHLVVYPLLSLSCANAIPDPAKLVPAGKTLLEITTLESPVPLVLNIGNRPNVGRGANVLLWISI